MVINTNLASYPEFTPLLTELLQGVQAILGSRLVGMYLDGSVATGDFDSASDIDFVAAVSEGISGEVFARLHSFHERLANFDSPWAIQLEGFYVPPEPLRRHIEPPVRVPNLERGEGEQLKWVDLNRNFAIHRFVLREGGITLAGPAPQTLVDAVSPEELRRAMQPLRESWLPGILADPASISFSGYKSYVVLSVCRMLYTLQTGKVASKRAAAEWAQGTLDAQYHALIGRAWEGRQNPLIFTTEADTLGTLEFIRMALQEA